MFIDVLRTVEKFGVWSAAGTLEANLREVHAASETETSEDVLRRRDCLGEPLLRLRLCSSLKRPLPTTLGLRGRVWPTGDLLPEDDLLRARLCFLGVGERDLSGMSSCLMSSDNFRLLECLASVLGEGERLRSGDRRVCRGLRRRGGVLDLEGDLVSDLCRLRLGGLRDGERELRWDGRGTLSYLLRDSPGTYLSFSAIGMRSPSISLRRYGGGDLEERRRSNSRPPRPPLPLPMPRSPRSRCLRLFTSLSRCRSSSRRRRAASAAFSASICVR